MTAFSSKFRREFLMTHNYVIKALVLANKHRVKLIVGVLIYSFMKRNQFRVPS